MVARRKTTVRTKRRSTPRAKSTTVRRYKKPTPKYRRYINPGTHVVPLREFVKMKYVSQKSLGAAASIIDSWQYQSSIFDPDLTGTGHQPYLHDTWSTLFSYYRVWGMKYEIRVVNTGTAPARFAVLHVGTAQSFDTTNFDLNVERSIIKKVHFLGVQDRSNVTIRGYMSVPKTEGLSKTAFIGESSYEVGFGANPSKMAKLVMIADSNQVWGMQVFVNITYYSELWGRKTQFQS